MRDVHRTPLATVRGTLYAMWVLLPKRKHTLSSDTLNQGRGGLFATAIYFNDSLAFIRFKFLGGLSRLLKNYAGRRNTRFGPRARLELLVQCSESLARQL